MISSAMKDLLVISFFGLSTLVSFVSNTVRYYGAFTVYGTGDTLLATFHNHGGPREPHRKWHIECLDGEGMIGVTDYFDDYQKFAGAWCRFMFPHKPPTNGLYPYYPSCLVRNFTTDFHCYSPKDHEASVNTFVTAFWDNDFQWWLFRGPPDNVQPYKCCRTPLGYHIDYSHCYYFPTHDLYGEYYDATNLFMVTCATGFVMTGISKKVDPWTQSAHIEWIQCCKIGLGSADYSIRPSRHTYDYNSYANNTFPNMPTGEYAAQYQARNFNGYHAMSREYVGSREDKVRNDPVELGRAILSEPASDTDTFYAPQRANQISM